jgi:UDP-N-acetylmuramate dehydrogenase
MVDMPTLERSMPLGKLTTYRVGGVARLGLVAGSATDLVDAGRAAAAHALAPLVVGRGSNMLVADGEVDVLAVVLDADRLDRIEIEPLASGGALVTADAMVGLPVLARRTVAAGLTGLEWAVGVPGSVGGGVRMNAGGHGSDIERSLVSALVVDLATGDMVEREAASIGLRFRRSALGPSEVVARATFRVASGDRDRSDVLLTEIVRWRREHQPGGQNAGSVFVNPRPDPAGRLIDALGLRGMRIGTAMVSDKHANFIQADPGGRAADVLAVMREVRRRVHESTGVLLRSEIRLVGFAPDDPPFDEGVGYSLDEAEEAS